jgi:hypothetical protein
VIIKSIKLKCDWANSKSTNAYKFVIEKLMQKEYSANLAEMGG